MDNNIQLINSLRLTPGFVNPITVLVMFTENSTSDVHRGKKNVLLYDTVSLFLDLYKVFSYV